MRLFLAVAVLMLAFVAYTEAQEETIKQRLVRYGEQLSEMGQLLAEKTKTAFENIQNSKIATQSRSLLTEFFEKMKAKHELTQ